MRTYYVYRIGDIAFEGHTNKKFQYGRFVENTLANGIVSHIFDIYRPIQKEHDLWFWKYYIHNENIMRDVLRKSTTKATMMTNLVNKDLLKQKLNIPILEEQKKIGRLFSQIDRTITLHEEKQRQLELLKKALLQKMFADNTGYPALRFKGFSDAWKHRKLGDVSLVRTGYAFKSSDFSKTGQYKIVTNKEFSNSSLSKNMKADRINISDKTLLSKYELSGQNILVTMDGVNIGKASLFSDSSAVLAQRVGRINSTQLDFIFSVINNSDFVNTMRSLAVGNAIKHISLRQISSYVFRSPISIKEQKLIGGLFKNFDNLITLHQHKIDNLKRLKRALLQKMFV